MDRIKIIFSTIFLLLSCQAFSQDLITADFQDEPLSEIFEKLRIQNALKFAYDTKLVQKYIISVKLKDQPLEKALVEILKKTNLTYEIENGIIIIKPLDKKPIADKKYIIKGIIKDSATSETLPYAAVCEKKRNKCVLSNDDGIFFISGKSNDDKIIIEFNYLGYKKEIRTFAADTLNIYHTIFLTPEEISFRDVIILDEQPSIIQKETDAGHYMINPAKMANVPQAGENDLLNTLEILPGISTVDNNSGLSVRGSTPEQNLIVLDGINLYHLDHFFGEFSAINPHVIKNVQIFKGGYEAKYGGRATSLTVFTCKNGNRNKQSVSVHLNMLSASFTSEMPLGKKISLLVAGRRSFSDFIESSVYKSIFKSIRNNKDETALNFGGIYEQTSNRISPKFYYYDANARLSFYPGEKDMISLSYFNCFDNFALNNIHPGNIYSSNSVNLNNWGNQGGSIRWNKKINSVFYSNLTLAISDFSNLYNSEGRYSLMNLASFNYSKKEKNTITDINLLINNELWLSNDNKAEFGFQLTRHKLSYNQELDTTKSLFINSKGFENSVYLQSRLNLFNDFTICPGIRTTFSLPSQKLFAEPRISATYKIAKKIIIKMALSRHNQLINKTTFTNNAESYRDLWFISNPDTQQFLVSNHFIGGVSMSTNLFDFDLESYYMNFNGIPTINQEPEGQLISLDKIIFGKGYSKGIDILVNTRSSKFYVSGGYSFCIVRNKFSELNNGEYFPADNDRRHEFKLLNMFYYKTWVFSAFWTCGSGKPYTDFNTGFYLSVPGEKKFFYLQKPLQNSMKLPFYHRLDLSCTYTFKKIWYTGNAGISIINVYGKDNVRSLHNSIKEVYENKGTKNYILEKTSISSLGFTPSLFINFLF